MDGSSLALRLATFLLQSPNPRVPPAAGGGLVGGGFVGGGLVGVAGPVEGSGPVPSASPFLLGSAGSSSLDTSDEGGVKAPPVVN